MREKGWRGAERRSDADRRSATDRRTGGDRRTGTDRRAGAPRPVLRERTPAGRLRTFVSAFVLSALAAVGSYGGTYRVMEMMFAPDVVTPVVSVSPLAVTGLPAASTVPAPSPGP